MKKFLVFGIFTIFFLNAFAANITFLGSSRNVLQFTPDKSSGLDYVFVAFSTSEIEEMRIGVEGSGINIKRYSNLGGGFAEDIAYEIAGDVAIIRNPVGDCGYIIEEDGRINGFWLVDYSKHPLQLTSVVAATEQDCSSTTLNLSGIGDAITYFTIDGRPEELSRDIKIEYHNLHWDDSSESFLQDKVIKEIAHIINPVILVPPLYCNSEIEVSGDRFLEEWGLGKNLVSSTIFANGIDVVTKAEELNEPEDGDDLSNLIKTETAGLGGSAPSEISFNAFTTDAVVHNEWQIASDSEFEYITYRFNEQNIDYTFTEEGTYYVRFIGSNSDGSCEAVGETYTVSIGASDLRIPNAFTPNEDGVNDVWKVAYRSLLSFKCSIFDRYGNEIFSFSDPSQGWDGKYKGKIAKPGVYFYVIEALGADGKKYKKGGDINLIRSKRNSTNSEGSSNY